MNLPTKTGLSARMHRLFNPRLGVLEAGLRVERERITRLEAELDELRRDNLRIAELTDLVEQYLTPHSE